MAVTKLLMWRLFRKAVQSCAYAASRINFSDASRQRFHSSNSGQFKRVSYGVSLLSAGGVAAAAKVPSQTQAQPDHAKPGEVRPDLPTFSYSEVAKHDNPANGVWVVYKRGVYDISKFMEIHPGGMDKIKMASGSSVAPYWAIYQQHNTEDVHEILEELRIGNVSAVDAAKFAAATVKLPSTSAAATTAAPASNPADPWSLEPARDPSFKINSARPFNAEPPLASLVSSFLTPNSLFFVRNHLPVPLIDEASYSLEIGGVGVRSKRFTLHDLKTKFPKHTVVAALQCAGNRRHDMMVIKPVKGLDWTGGAISNAVWGGVRLSDVLAACGLDKDGALKAGVNHIQFEGLDRDPTGLFYGGSILVNRALNPDQDVLLAWEMNGEPLPRDHGAPLRVVVPGVSGTRSVKWVGRIVASREESPNHWQQKDYKGFCPSVDWHNVDFKSAPAIQELPVTSHICKPAPNDTIKVDLSKPVPQVTLEGYAWSGGGRSVVRVDVSADGGKTWTVANILPVPPNGIAVGGVEGLGSDFLERQRQFGQSWAWSLWKASIDLPAEVVAKLKESNAAQPVQLVCKAIDSSYNNQPDSVEPIWNLRGVLCNSWSRVTVNVSKQ